MAVEINRFSFSDLDVLRSVNLDCEIIAIDQSSVSPKIVRIAKNQITCFQKFLAFFGFGSLANKKIHLSSVVQSLNEYDKSGLDAEVLDKISSIEKKLNLKIERLEKRKEASDKLNDSYWTTYDMLKIIENHKKRIGKFNQE